MNNPMTDGLFNGRSALHLGSNKRIKDHHRPYENWTVWSTARRLLENASANITTKCLSTASSRDLMSEYIDPQIERHMKLNTFEHSHEDDRKMPASSHPNIRNTKTPQDVAFYADNNKNRNKRRNTVSPQQCDQAFMKSSVSSTFHDLQHKDIQNHDQNDSSLSLVLEDFSHQQRQHAGYHNHGGICLDFDEDADALVMTTWPKWGQHHMPSKYSEGTRKRDPPAVASATSGDSFSSHVSDFNRVSTDIIEQQERIWQQIQQERKKNNIKQQREEKLSSCHTMGTSSRTHRTGYNACVPEQELRYNQVKTQQRQLKFCPQPLSIDRAQGYENLNGEHARPYTTVARTYPTHSHTTAPPTDHISSRYSDRRTRRNSGINDKSNNCMNSVHVQGFEVKIHPPSKTNQALERGQAVMVKCITCQNKLWAATENNTVSMVYCPACGTLSPMNLAIKTLAESSGS